MMEKRVIELLENRGGNYILPFFWQHGESEEVLRDYMRAIDECGIGEVCVECRPHPDFCGPKWWTDMDIIMDEAKKRSMKVWLLDDAHFPTGFANGAMKEADPALCKQYINYNAADVTGGVSQVALDIASMAKYRPNPFAGGMSMFMGGEPRVFDDDSLLCVIACPLMRDEKLGHEVIDLTDSVENGRLIWDAPAGMWRIFVIYNTKNGGGRTDYINVLDEASCRVQIDAVYEPHWQRYKDDFGKTFLGFFSDEPLFGNTLGFNFDELIGRKDMPLPWNKDVPGMLKERLGADWHKRLPALWNDLDCPDATAGARYAYMDTVTALVQKNFSEQIGGWCSDHGVEYIGHLIEDSNQHSRLGSSLGHYFRGLQGQHMAGIDDIGNQVLLNGENHRRKGGFTEGDGEFFHFTLGKLASSHAHIDPKKKGRAMCEIYGAYGWDFGVRRMKYVTDHFLVRGVNRYVPHAFSPKEYPDPDCPPHFYAHGHNPQYRHFQKLMGYMNRVCHLIDGGTHIAPVAMLYHGEAEWTGGYMYNQKPARALHENQIDFDIIPSDLFADMKQFNASFDGKLHVNGETYSALVLPYAEYVTAEVAAFAAGAAKKGFEVVFVDALPSGIMNPADPSAAKALTAGLDGCKAVPLGELAQYLRDRGICELSSSVKYDRLRYYHYKLDSDILLINNEDATCCYEGEITVDIAGDVVAYDAYENVLRPADYRAENGKTVIKARLEPFDMLVLIFGDSGKGYDLIAPAMAEGSRQVVTGAWDVSVAKSKEYPEFHDQMKLDRLDSIGFIHPEFSGFVRYENTVKLDACSSAVLEIEDAYEGVELWVNGESAGSRICPPYRFDISKLVKAGANTLRIEVATTLDREVRAMGGDNVRSVMRQSPVLEPTGIVGEVSIYTKK